MTSRLHPTDIPTPQGDFVSIAPAVAGRFGHVKGARMANAKNSVVSLHSNNSPLPEPPP